MSVRDSIPETLADFVARLDSANPAQNAAHLVDELGLFNKHMVSVNEAEEQIQYRIAGFTTTRGGQVEHDHQIGFDKPGTAKVAVFLEKLSIILGEDEFEMTTKMLLAARAYFGANETERAAIERQLYDKPLNALMQSGSAVVTIKRPKRH